MTAARATTAAEPELATCCCEPAMLALELVDVRCPEHGLVAFLRETFVTREDGDG